MKGKNVVITGGTSGIGKATTLKLKEMGANIFTVSRKESGIGKSFIADLSLQDNIRKVAEEINKSVEVIDVLINNAGGIFSTFKSTQDGIEQTIALNHMSYFLLTNLLLDKIKKSEYARIVNVSSQMHYQGEIDIESFTRNKNFEPYSAYSNSKLCNVLFTVDVAEILKGTHVIANRLHPGAVNTNFGKGTRYAMSYGITPEKGAETSVYLASSADVKGVTGKYFDNCQEKKPSELAFDIDLRKTLWKESEKLCK